MIQFDIFNGKLIDAVQVLIHEVHGVNLAEFTCVVKRMFAANKIFILLLPIPKEKDTSSQLFHQEVKQQFF